MPTQRLGTPTTAPAHPLPLHAALLRRSVGELANGRPACAHCRRSPLVGERVYLYEGSGADRLVCELCRPQRRESPARSELVRAPEGERAVRVRRRSG